MGEYLLISDAAKQVKVESHVLRYWEEELHLPIKRNELGHRYYTKEDVERFKEIKSMKERGLQLKAIKMILKDGRLDVLPEEREKEPVEARKEPAEVRTPHMAIEIVDKPVDKEMPVQPQERICTVPEKEGLQSESREEKAKRLQWILQQLIREAVRENLLRWSPGRFHRAQAPDRSRPETGTLLSAVHPGTSVCVPGCPLLLIIQWIPPSWGWIPVC